MCWCMAARAASGLNHPNIITIYEIGEDQGLHFIAYEYIEGHTLRKKMTRGLMNVKEAIEIALQAASALAAAHSAGIIHRDVKPENIMVRRDGYVKILDFGLVKPVADGSFEGSLATERGLVVGTPGYMAPEIALSATVDGRADLYSLGCVAYYLLTGREVFEGDTPMQVFAHHFQTAPTPPSQRGPHAVPEDLEKLVLSCLAKKPEERFQTGDEMAKAIRACAASLTADTVDIGL